jgi:hypothetical protein
MTFGVPTLNAPNARRPFRARPTFGVSTLNAPSVRRPFGECARRAARTSALRRSDTPERALAPEPYTRRTRPAAPARTGGTHTPDAPHAPEALTHQAPTHATALHASDRAGRHPNHLPSRHAALRAAEKLDTPELAPFWRTPSLWWSGSGNGLVVGGAAVAQAAVEALTHRAGPCTPRRKPPDVTATPKPPTQARTPT